MKRYWAFVIIVGLIVTVYAIRDISFATGSSAPPTCTNTTIDKYYSCKSNIPPLLSR